MVQPKPIEDVIGQALQYSLRLEDRRGELTDFEVKRLAHEISSAGNNAMVTALHDVLVGEIERDFQKLDTAAEQVFSMPAGPGLFANIGNLVLFAFNPELASAMSRHAFELDSESPELLEHLLLNAWYSGDMQLCQEIYHRMKVLQVDLDKVEHFQFEYTFSVLERSGVPISEYREAIVGLHSIIRPYVAGKRNVRVLLNFEPVNHEDGYEGIVAEVSFDGLEEEILDHLDDSLLDWTADPERVSPELSRVVTFLARDIPKQQPIREAC